jgi:predicted glycoside hydrolase/deacetylase ChbG (UPF0249 family)
MGERVLVVNADDFGLSPGVNEGIAKAHEDGIVTSASLMVRGSAATEAADYARRTPELAVGLHVDLGEWEYREGEWRLSYQVVAPDDQEAARGEVAAQLDVFRRLMDRDPTHLDSHQHLHLATAASNVLTEVGEKLGVPVRHLTPDITYMGEFYGQSDKGYPHPDAITPKALIHLITEIATGVTELGCHPAGSVDFQSVYADERVTEVATLCDRRLREVLTTQRIALRSFAELNAIRNAAR